MMQTLEVNPTALLQLISLTGFLIGVVITSAINTLSNYLAEDIEKKGKRR
jgi:hypothetical protein